MNRGRAWLKKWQPSRGTFRELLAVGPITGAELFASVPRCQTGGAGFTAGSVQDQGRWQVLTASGRPLRSTGDTRSERKRNGSIIVDYCGIVGRCCGLSKALRFCRASSYDLNLLGLIHIGIGTPELPHPSSV